jgi:EAL domain-containing protein (putative c-di-GMP-specific phosphodiesterase class I)/ActR/RegA family two-component response regulator
MSATRVLIVDDDEHIALLASRALEELATSDTAGSIGEALDALERATYDVVLVDLSLSDGSGMNLLDALRDLSPHSVPVMLSGVSDLAVAREALSKGALGYVVKPFRVRDLRIQIAAALAVAGRSANASRVSARGRAVAMLAPLLARRDPPACLVVELEHLPTLGASFGADAIERVCDCVAQRLHRFDPSLHVVGQLGPSSFAATLTVAGARSPARAAGELHRILSAPVVYEAQRIPIAPRIGIVVVAPGESADTALGLAEAAADAARDRETAFVVYDGEPDDAARMQFDLIADVATAIHRGEFHLAYQSQWDLRTGELTGFEALARWKHPTQGDIPPAVFVPLAERLGLIADLGAFVLRRACTEVAQLRRSHGLDTLRVSVNVSALELRDQVYPTVVAVTLAEAGLPPSALLLEVTESVALSESDELHRVLKGLRALGVQLSVDDFGTGYSSFDNLARIDWAEIKLDRSITSRTDNDCGREMTRSILSFGSALGIDVIAEGIETTDELDALRALGCEYGQGFLLGRPQSMAELAELPVADGWPTAPVLAGSSA